MESSAAVSPSGYAVQVEIPRPPKTRRLLLLFRWLLLFPQYFFALVVVLAGGVAVLINYFVVLITGRAAFSAFLSGVVRYLTRLNAYQYFLTDSYPPFSLAEKPDYPIQVHIEHPGKIHRWRFFSFILAFPHILILYGLFIVSGVFTLIAFFIALITARYPPGLFGLVAATMRYQARVNAYLYLIVSHYPPFSLS